MGLPHRALPHPEFSPQGAAGARGFRRGTFRRLAERQAARIEEFDSRGAALQACLETLPRLLRELVERRYAPGGSVQRIAEADGKSVGAISQTPYRLRETLLNCVRQAEAGT